MKGIYLWHAVVAPVALDMGCGDRVGEVRNEEAKKECSGGDERRRGE